MSDSSGRDETSSNDTDQDKGGPRPTIVGSQPSANSNRTGGIPLGVEALLKKASVDPDFRRALLENHAEAAHEIDLELTAVEAAMLNSIPQAQIEQIIDKTTVPTEHRRVFLGKVGAAMLAVLSLELAACLPGCSPDRPKPKIRPQGIRPDYPVRPQKPKPEVRLNTGKQFLDVAVADTGSNSVTVPVKYECPYEKGTLRIFFADQYKDKVTAVQSRTRVVSVSKGNGGTTFQASGKGRKTGWLLVRMADSDKKCRLEAPVSIADLPTDDEPREYLVDDCSVWRIVKFHKEWKSKG